MNDFGSLETKRIKSAVDNTSTAQSIQKQSNIETTAIMIAMAAMIIRAIIVFSLC
jgi:hypothetical protein